MSETYRLPFQEVNEGLIQVSWFDPSNGDLRWRIHKGHFESTARELRGALETYLADFYAAQEEAATAESLLNLGRAGRDFFDAMFAAVEHTQQAHEALDQYWLLDASTETIALKVDPTMIFPWSLAVPEALPRGRPLGLDDLRRMFWCFRHGLTVSTFGAGAAKARSVAVGQWRAMALVNQYVYERAVLSLEAEGEKSWSQAFFNGLATLGFSSEELEDWIRAAASPDVKLRMAYLLGHAQGDKFEFSATDELTASRLALWLSKTRSTSPGQITVLFLNGCATTAEAQGFRFGDIAGQFMVNALLGTEVKVPDRFAFRFALGFLELVLGKGCTFRDALDRLKRLHLPVSLAYSLYAADGLTLDPCQEAAWPLGAEVNYSLERLTCEP